MQLHEFPLTFDPDDLGIIASEVNGGIEAPHAQLEMSFSALGTLLRTLKICSAVTYVRVGEGQSCRCGVLDSTSAQDEKQ